MKSPALNFGSIAALADAVARSAREQRLLSGFTIGNTSKRGSAYFTPLRSTGIMITAGAIVYDGTEAARIIDLIDGRIDYIIVDVERKIRGDGIEPVLRRQIRHSKVWFYKGNDLAVDAVDSLIAHRYQRDQNGLAGKKVAICGAGNIGFKLALRLVERGARVVATRRELSTVAKLAAAINLIKPRFTSASAEASTDPRAAARNAHVLVGASSGYAVITAPMVESLAEGGIIIDVGKGTLSAKAVAAARGRSLPVFRLDITAAFEGLLHRLWATENQNDQKAGRCWWHGEQIISGGLLGEKGDAVVDDIKNPKVIYGFANGRGDFLKKLTLAQRRRLAQLKSHLLRKSPPPERRTAI